MKAKLSQRLSDVFLCGGLAIFVGLLLMPLLMAVASVAWLFITATTPDIFSFRVALLLGIVLGLLIVGASLFAASKVSGDAFPDLLAGLVIPSVVILLASFILQPVAARLTRNRIAQRQIVVSRPAK